NLLIGGHLLAHDRACIEAQADWLVGNSSRGTSRLLRGKCPYCNCPRSLRKPHATSRARVGHWISHLRVCAKWNRKNSRLGRVAPVGGSDQRAPPKRLTIACEAARADMGIPNCPLGTSSSRTLISVLLAFSCFTGRSLTR